jgi:hypothetical protein
VHVAIQGLLGVAQVGLAGGGGGRPLSQAVFAVQVHCACRFGSRPGLTRRPHLLPQLLHHRVSGSPPFTQCYILFNLFLLYALAYNSL